MVIPGCDLTEPEEVYPAYLTDTLKITYLGDEAIDSAFWEDETRLPIGVGSHQAHYDTIYFRDTLEPEISWDDVEGTTWYLHEPEYRVLHRITFKKDSVELFKQYYTPVDQVSGKGYLIQEGTIYREKMQRAKVERSRYVRDEDNDVLYEFNLCWREYWDNGDGTWLKPVQTGTCGIHFIFRIKSNYLHFGWKDNGIYKYKEWGRTLPIILKRR